MGLIKKTKIATHEILLRSNTRTTNTILRLHEFQKKDQETKKKNEKQVGQHYTKLKNKWEHQKEISTH